jgi:hypothetical protein
MLTPPKYGRPMSHDLMRLIAILETESFSFTSVPWRLLVLEVPLALVDAALGRPAEADAAVGQHRAAGGVEGHRLPLGVVLPGRACR